MFNIKVLLKKYLSEFDFYDEDYYPGEICVVLFNHSDEDFIYEKHTRVAQLVILPILTPDIVEITKEDFNNKNERDAKGFGSTGLL